MGRKYQYQLDRLSFLIVTLTKALLVISMTFLFLAVFIGVVLRFMGKSVPSTSELSQFMLIAVVFLGGSVAVYQKRHVSIKYFLNLFPPAGGKVIIIIVHLISIIVALFFVKVTWDFTILAPMELSSVLQIPMSWVQIIPVIGGILMLVHFIIQTLKIFSQDANELKIMVCKNMAKSEDS